MALAEARSAWQRTANRYLVQEDAKRAPKLACCSTTGPPVKPDDVGPTNTADKEDIPNISRPPLNQNSSYFKLSPNSRWWLQLQPNCGYQNSLMNEQFDSNMETLATHESSSVHSQNETAYLGSSLDNHSSGFATCENKDCRVEEREIRSLYSKNSKYPLENDGAIDFGELKNTDFFDCKVSEKSSELYWDSKSSWIGAEKNVPWWRTADTEELAILVSQRSLDVIENCDLPRPQNTRVGKDLYTNVCGFGCGGVYESSLDPKPNIGSYQNLTVPTPYSLKAESARQKYWAAIEYQPLPSANKSMRDCDPKNSDSPTRKGAPEMHTISENDPSKAQLLEALRHSQTRAREAEKAAKRACVEKEHIVKLVFTQASQLFAYKQWFHLLQLENIYFQMKNNYSQPISTVLPRVPQRPRKMLKSWQKSTRGKCAKKARYRYDISKYAIIFALGLGLVGAGLLLGWTVGLMLPTL
ncbi:hypothetical protein Adt_44892 [Abeliophyllum distichum]|uniref:Uncharacterized protein n=1 Tax=Abeliophyllum distichum TaxID=126358 RepID=A0ABD1PC81_9LAMI